MLDLQELAIAKIFNPYVTAQYERAASKNVRFVHYTTAESACGIIRSNDVWMRNVRTMNDFSEVQYGLELLSQAYRETLRERLVQVLDPISDQICSNVEHLFNGWSRRFTELTYLACVSEHDPDEDEIGRLSMWRAYGGPASVAIVMKNTPFLTPCDILGAYTNPVLYADKEAFIRETVMFAERIEASAETIRSLDVEEIMSRVFNQFLFFALSTKHPGFKEEREWRVFHVDGMHPVENLRRDVEAVKGVPQFVYKLPLRDIPASDGERGFFGASVKDLVDRVIVGPSDSGLVIRDAMVHLLEGAGVADASERVFVSGIPLR